MEGLHTMSEDAKKTKWNTTFTQAKKFDINRMAAARIKTRFLLDRVNTYLQDGSDVALQWASEDLEEVFYILDKACYTRTDVSRTIQNSVTDEMKEQALAYPVASLVDLHNERTRAWCHPDTKPSLVKYRKENKLHCFVCGKSFNPIDCVMHQQGLKYYDAIRYLVGL
jgi:hypothetical protein